MAYYIGLMSGTSLDGVDGVLAEQATEGQQALQSRGHVHLPFPPALRAELLALNHSGSDELHRAALAANALARVYAEMVHQLLLRSRLAASAVSAIGAHGQTVRHQPGGFDGTGYTLQLINGALLAELTGITVVCDFRSRDVAAGGQGAPLVPAFHAARFRQAGGPPYQARAVLNLGGIANLTLLQKDGGVLGFDTGPANVLMDLWCQRHTGQTMDEGGCWATGGQVDPTLLSTWLAEPYFALPPPKSTGRDLFNAAWLDAQPGRRCEARRRRCDGHAGRADGTQRRRGFARKGARHTSTVCLRRRRAQQPRADAVAPRTARVGSGQHGRPGCGARPDGSAGLCVAGTCLPGG